jgi:hypothetical protein
MRATILLDHTENTKQVEEEEKSRFLRSILEQCGVPIQEVWADESPLTVEQKIKVRGILAVYNMQVIDDLDGHMAIYLSSEGKNEKIAEWFKSTYKLKSDLSQLDRKKRLFLEMSVNCWSLFEESE